ncbi:Inorganic pyrophosphatase [Posidoniimonas polymericola]|uniref:inorganic diphosphatase n=1 Tax=Posidoniimonas polymericola TaxID=2528002 RepID=A0A5C5ZFY4_9BACT|nr:inorganic diphosphatase [Posidoniimonas polymericola]TWT85473.1 Inorganic pyrophosphatase [Posidoniimonas polymericola]
MNHLRLATNVLLACAVAACACTPASPVAVKHLVHDYPAEDVSGLVNVVVEIPAGTNQKWETDKQSGRLVWDTKDGVPRVVAYLPYPGNYGMIPRTLLPKSLGGDGDPLDVLVLGPAVPRGSVVQARVIGVLRMLDSGEQDDKLIAVAPESALGGVKSLEELQRDFPAAAEIVELWFTHYKGPGEMQSQGYAEADEARRILKTAIAAYQDDAATLD